MNHYFIPVVDRTYAEYAQFITAMPWDFPEGSSRGLTITFEKQTVSTDGTIIDFALVADPNPMPVAVVEITKLEFLSRFTDIELATILTAAKQSVQLEVFLKKLDAAQSVTLSDPRTIGSIQFLESVGLLNTGRAAEILGA